MAEPPGSSRDLRTELVARLRSRLPEIEQALLTRAHAIADPSDADPTYRESLRTSISLALDYAMEAIERGEAHAPPPPPGLLAQARLAARTGVALDTVLRRYLAGYTVLGDFLNAEAERSGLPAGAFSAFLRVCAVLLDRLLGAVSEEYRREAEQLLVGSERAPVRLVRRLLGGELVDPSPLGYDLDGSHIGLVACGGEATALLRDLAAELDRRLLVVEPDERTTWAWLGSRRNGGLGDLQPIAEQCLSGGLALSVGEPARGISGWRLTHRQAATALPVARRQGGLARYGDVPLLAAALRDELLATSLRRLYLEPLRGERDGGRAARSTLRAYFAAARNVSSAAAALGVNRRTVSSRLTAIEKRLSRRIDTASAEIETALRLEEIEGRPD